MIQRYKHFNVFKLNDDSNANPKMPSHRIACRLVEGGKGETIGKCWTKDGKYGKYLSGSLNDVYIDHSDSSKSREAFCVVKESDLDYLESMVSTGVANKPSTKTSPGVSGEVIDLNDVPF